MDNNVFCWECGAKISKGATICSKCGAKQKGVSNVNKDNAAHSSQSAKKSTPVIVWVLFLIFGLPALILLCVIVIALLVGMGSVSNADSNMSYTTTNSNYVVGAITRENYDLIKTGMSKSDVFKILGTNATISESETPGVGLMEMYNYQDIWAGKSIMITFWNGEVYSKNWVEL